jgi:TRAP-type C4-dicarboxylate transport system permease small subunit
LYGIVDEKPSVFEQMRQYLNHVYRLCDWLAALCVLVLTIIVVVQILGRMAGITIPGAHEAAAFLMAAAIYLALAYTLAVNGHIRVTLVLERLKPKARWWTEIWCHVFSIYMIGYLAIFSVILAWRSWQGEESSEGLIPIPLFIPQIAMALGVCLLELRLLDQLVELLRFGAIKAETERADLPEGHA